MWCRGSWRPFHWIALTLRETGRDDVADRLDRAVYDEVKLLALTIPTLADPRGARDPPPELAELRAVLVNEHPS